MVTSDELRTAFEAIGATDFTFSQYINPLGWNVMRISVKSPFRNIASRVGQVLDQRFDVIREHNHTLIEYHGDTPSDYRNEFIGMYSVKAEDVVTDEIAEPVAVDITEDVIMAKKPSSPTKTPTMPKMPGMPMRDMPKMPSMPSKGGGKKGR